MQALYHSPFLQALGYAIANSLWQVALLWLVVILVNGLVNFSAATRYRIALTAQLGAFTWFLVTFKVYFQQCTAAVQALDSLNITHENAWIVTPEATSFRSALLAWTIRIEQLLPFLSIAYLFLLVFLGVKWFRTYRKAQYIRVAGLHKIDVEWRLFVQKVATQLDIKPKVQIFLSSIVTSPLTIGYLKPIILIPVASITHLTPQQLEALILHELAHIRRADYFVNLLQSIIEITLFFNPFTQLLSRQIRNERENSCDDWVLQFQYNPSMYAEALLRMAHLQAAPALAMQARGNKGELLPRVKRMLNQREKSFNYKQHLFALLIMTGVLSAAAWLQPGSRSNAFAQTQQRNDQRSVLIEPITARVDNPLFNPVFFLARPLQEEVKAKAKVKEPEKIRAVAAVRYQEPRIALAATEVAEADMDSAFAILPATTAENTVVAVPPPPPPQIVMQHQRMQEMFPTPVAPEVFNFQYRFLNSQHQHYNAARMRMKIPAPHAAPRTIRQPRPAPREFGPIPPPPPIAVLRQIKDTARHNAYQRHINRMLASFIKEVADSGRFAAQEFRLFKEFPAAGLIDVQAIDEAFKLFDRKETWAYYRPVVRERERNRHDAAVAVSGRAAASAVSSRSGETSSAITVAPPAVQVVQFQFAASAEKNQTPAQQQVVTYQYKDVTITISSSTGVHQNGSTPSTGGTQLITIRKVVKDARAEIPEQTGFLAEPQQVPSVLEMD